MEQTLMHQWSRTRDKGSLKFYRDDQFRSYYTEQKMQKKVNIVYGLIKDPLQSMILSTTQDTYKILSLGCGPGSDLVAVIQVFQTIFEKHPWLKGTVIECIGVDMFRWPTNKLDELARPLEGCVQRRFYFETDMECFAKNAINNALSNIKCQIRLFDVIILSFTDVKARVAFVGSELPLLLRKGGRIFVIDNNISKVRRLTSYGYKEKLWNDNKNVFLELKQEQAIFSENENMDCIDYNDERMEFFADRAAERQLREMAKRQKKISRRQAEHTVPGNKRSSHTHRHGKPHGFDSDDNRMEQY